MRRLTARTITALQTRWHAANRDDRGMETAEVLLWMALSAAGIVLLSDRLFGVLGGLVDTIEGLLP